MTGKRIAYLLCVTVCAMLVSSGCNSATPDYHTPTPTTVQTRTATPTIPAVVTYSPTQADPTPRPSNTPTPCGTCEPLHPALYGSVILQSWEDSDGDGEWRMGSETDYQEWGVPSTVTLLYDGDLPLSVWNVTGVQIPTGWRGIAVYTTLLPGLYTVVITDYDEQRCLVPYADSDIWAQVQAAGQTVVKARFWRRPGCYSYGTPTVTPTPKPTSTPFSVPCPNYYDDCRVECTGNTYADQYKTCQPPLLCCMPMPTRTAVPTP